MRLAPDASGSSISVLGAGNVDGDGLGDLAAARRVYHTVGLHIGNDGCICRPTPERTAPARTRSARKSVMIRFVFSTSLCCVFGVFGNKIPQNARKCNRPRGLIRGNRKWRVHRKARLILVRNTNCLAFFRESPLISIRKYDMIALETAPDGKRAARAAHMIKSKELHLMIITQKKPLEEVLALVGEAKTVAVIGCGLCASTCQTGGAPEVEAMKKTLEEAGKTVVITDVADACCMKLGVRAKCKAISTAAPDCIVCMSCGDGVQTIAKKLHGYPRLPLPTIPCSSARSRAGHLGRSVQDVRRLRARHNRRHLSHHPVRQEPSQRPLRRPEERQVRSKPRKRLRVDPDLQAPRAARPARQAHHDAAATRAMRRSRIRERSTRGGRRHEQIKRSTETGQFGVTAEMAPPEGL